MQNRVKRADFELEKAKNYAFLLLKFRPRSEKELALRLKKKRFDERIIREITAFLKDRDFINDTEFSRAWIEARLKKPLGPRRIEEELRQKGIDREIIESQLEAVKSDYPEKEIVAKISRQKIKQLKGVKTHKKKQRIFSYLLRRGFSYTVVMDAVNNL